MNMNYAVYNNLDNACNCICYVKGLLTASKIREKPIYKAARHVSMSHANKRISLLTNLQQPCSIRAGAVLREVWGRDTPRTENCEFTRQIKNFPPSTRQMTCRRFSSNRGGRALSHLSHGRQSTFHLKVAL